MQAIYHPQIFNVFRITSATFASPIFFFQWGPYFILRVVIYVILSECLRYYLWCQLGPTSGIIRISWTGPKTTSPRPELIRSSEHVFNLHRTELLFRTTKMINIHCKFLRIAVNG